MYTIGGTQQLYAIEEINETVNFSYNKHLTLTMRLPLLQCLFYRYDKDVQTELKDLRVDTNGMLLSTNETKTKRPKKDHPDVWHRLFTFNSHVNKLAATNQHKGSSREYSYYLNVIDKLQEYLNDYGGKEGHLYQWLKKHYPYMVEGHDCLYVQVLRSLADEQVDGSNANGTPKYIYKANKNRDGNLYLNTYKNGGYHIRSLHSVELTDFAHKSAFSKVI